MDRNLPSHALPANVPQALGRLRVALDDAYTRAGREVGLTAQQAELLCAVLSPAAVGDLAEVLRCDRSNVSRLVDRAAAHDLVRRRGGDRDGRVTMIELRPTGRRLAKRFLASLESQTKALLDQWPEERQGLATRILNDIADALDASRAGPPQRRRSARPDAKVRPHGRSNSQLSSGTGPRARGPRVPD